MKILSTSKEIWLLLKYWRNHPLAAQTLMGTIGRFFRWQIGSRLLHAPVIVPWLGSSRLVVETGMTGATMNVYCGLHEFEDMGFLLHFLQKDDCFADIGANVGSYTVLAAKLQDAHVISVEPVPSTFTKLELNILVNGISDRVRAVQIGLGPVDNAVLEFIADKDTTNRVAPLGYSGATVKVPIKTADSLFSKFEAIMWKVDVEGFEEEVLSSALQSLRRPTLLAVQLEGDNEKISEIMTEAGFSKYEYDPLTRRLQPLMGGKRSHNWLWIRDPEFVIERCRSAPALTINGVTF